MPTTPDPALEAARERVVRLLTDRYADDSLTVEEFEARLDRMHALAEPAALDAMALELERAAPATLAAAPAYRPAAYQPAAYQPAAYQPAAYQPAAYQPAATAPVPVGQRWAAGAPALGGSVGLTPAAPDRGRVLAILSSTKRRGVWAVPPALQAVAVMGELVLDLREATLPPACDIEVFALMGNVRLILPAGADAYVEVDAFLAAAEDHTRGHYLGSPGTGPRVRVTGLAIMAEVKVVGG